MTRHGHFRPFRVRKRDQPLGPGKAQNALSTVLNRYGIAKEIREHRILIQWHKIVGPRVGKHTTPDALDKGLLWVRVDSSSWMHQISFLKSEIIAKANDLCGKELVKDIRFHLGRRKAVSNDPLSAASKIKRPDAKERPMPIPAQGARLDLIKKEASGIVDDELREAIIDMRRRLNL